MVPVFLEFKLISWWVHIAWFMSQDLLSFFSGMLLIYSILIVDWKLEKVLQLDLHQGKSQSLSFCHHRISSNLWVHTCTLVHHAIPRGTALWGATCTLHPPEVKSGGENYMGTPGVFAPELQKRTLENKKEPLKIAIDCNVKACAMLQI